MSCQKVQERLSAWLDGELEEKVAQEMAAHLAECAVCRRELAILQRLHDALANLTAPSPPDVTAKVLRHLPRRRRRSGWRSLSLAASLVLGLYLGHAVTGTLYLLPNRNQVGDLAIADVFMEYPLGSWGELFGSLNGEEGNGA